MSIENEPGGNPEYAAVADLSPEQVEKVHAVIDPLIARNREVAGGVAEVSANDQITAEMRDTFAKLSGLDMSDPKVYAAALFGMQLSTGYQEMLTNMLGSDPEVAKDTFRGAFASAAPAELQPK